MRRKSVGLVALVACSSLLAVACGSDEESTATTAASTETTGGSTDTTETTEASSDVWAVNTDDCIDPEAADALIEGTIKVGGVMPLTGETMADEAFSPVVQGWQAYFDYANENGLLGDITIEYKIEDDQYNKDLTPNAVSSLIDDGTQVFSGILGSPNNLAVRDTLNEECIPQLGALTGLPAWGDDVADYPWTTGQLVDYRTESRVYMQAIQEEFPDGANVALFYVNSDFGQSFADTVKEEGAEFGITVVEEQTIDPTDTAPPASQLTTIAAVKPDALIAVPLGTGCIGYLTTLAEKKAQDPSWTPLNYVTNTCATALILTLAGAGADGMLTSNNLIDVLDPANADVEGVKTYLEYAEKMGFLDVASTASAGWNTAETTVAIIKQALESSDGLTRASIINAARNFTYTPSLGRPGVVFKMNGVADSFLSQSLQVLRYNAGTTLFEPVGDVITAFEF